MKSEIIPTPHPKAEFPCLKRSKYNELVAIFIAPQKGTLVYPGNSGFPIGSYFESWADDAFEPLALGEVVKLSN